MQMPMLNMLVEDFNQNWKRDIQKMNDNVMAHFSNFRNGMEILRQVSPLNVACGILRAACCVLHLACGILRAACRVLLLPARDNIPPAGEASALPLRVP
jgi:hypothetical protein